MGKRVTNVRCQVKHNPQANGGGFEQFLSEHARLLGRLEQWSIVAICPSRFARGLEACRVIFERFRTGAVDTTASIHDGELRWYFETRRAVEQQQLATLSVQELNRFRDARRRFAAPRFDTWYETWLHDGDDVLEKTPDAIFSTAALSVAGSFHTRVLSHGYEQFGALPGVC